ncbi:MAG: phosphoenolpyruvate--protein phosphotransferase [Betaproteobacteria bacterium]|nr:phosphoenolpyruvate--protein phosphotransferase [Betaproteobacteria bacterium]
MAFSIHGLSVSRGVVMGRAVLVGSSRRDVAHYFVEPEQVAVEIDRLRAGRNAVIEEIIRLQASIQQMGPKDTPQELRALLDVHLMLLKDEVLVEGVKQWVSERFYNAEWALTAQLEVLSRNFDDMEDPYLRERKADLEQIVERVLRAMQGVASPVLPGGPDRRRKPRKSDTEAAEADLILVAHDLSPADMLHFKQSAFSGFVTDVGGKTSHTAIVARSLDIPAVVGTRSASQLVRQDDWIIIDGDAGLVIVDPSPPIRAEYQRKQAQNLAERARLARLLHTPAVTRDGQMVELMANIEVPQDVSAALACGAVGVGLFRSEFLFMGRHGHLPDEEEQFAAYRRAVEDMHGLPVTIRTIDIGADKPLDGSQRDDAHLNPALGLRAIRWSLAEPAMFTTQLRAILRAAAFGQVHLLVPMLAHESQIQQTLAHLARARASLDRRGVAYGPVQLGAMIEIPAAALNLRPFLAHFDFLSLGTNDLIQYTLAVDRTDESVAHLYEPLHPAVLRLVAETISQARKSGKGVAVCGEMAGDVAMTHLLLGLGLRNFSMHPSRILAVKEEVLRADTRVLAPWAAGVVAADHPDQAILLR